MGSNPRRWSPRSRGPLQPAGLLLAAVALVSTPIQGQQRGGLGAFETQGDIGGPRVPGSGTYNAVSQTYALAAGGVNMWADRDEFHFAWRRMTGDFILQARVEFVGQGTDPHRKVGWMVRRSQDDNAPYVDGVVHGSGLTSLQYRRSAGAATERNPAVGHRGRRPATGATGQHVHVLRGEVR